MEKKATQRASVTVCVPGNIALWLLSVWERTEKSDEPIICKLLRGNSNLSISSGDILWSPLSVGLCLFLLCVLPTSCRRWRTTVGYLLPVVTSSLNRVSVFPFSLYATSKDCPQSITVTHIKEATPLKLNSVVANQNEITESENGVELLTIGYKCWSSHPWIKGIVYPEKNPLFLEEPVGWLRIFPGNNINLLYILFSVKYFLSGKFSEL